MAGQDLCRDPRGPSGSIEGLKQRHTVQPSQNGPEDNLEVVPFSDIS